MGQPDIIQLGQLVLMLCLVQGLLRDIELLRKPCGLAFQLLDMGFGLPDLILVVEPLPCQMLSFLGYRSLGFFH